MYRDEPPLPAEPASGRGRRHGTSSSEPFDRWFRYPAGFASDYVAILLEHLNLPSGGSIVDPFAGSAVTGTAARIAGLSFFGLEAHPLIAELGSLKLNGKITVPAELKKYGDEIVAKAETVSPSGGRSPRVEPELIRRSFSDETLGQLLRLRTAIKQFPAEPWNLYLKWALLGTLRDVASVRVGWPYQRPSASRRPKYSNPYARFQQRISWMIEDMLAIKEIDISQEHVARMTNGDSRKALSWSQALPRKVDGCISSPPYLNNFDYADATRLELYFWGDVTNWAAMCRSVRSEMIISTTQQTSVGGTEKALKRISPLQPAGREILKIVSRLQAERLKRPRGKEYDRVVPEYFTAMAEVLKNLSDHLVSRAPVILLIGDSAPYGVYIDTPRIISEIAGEFGLVTEKNIILRKRGDRWPHNPSRHNIALSERLIMLRRV